MILKTDTTQFLFPSGVSDSLPEPSDNRKLRLEPGTTSVPGIFLQFRGKDCTQTMEQTQDRLVVGQRVRIDGGDMEFAVSRVDDAAQTIDLTPAEQGFSVVRNVPFGHVRRSAKNGHLS